MATTPVATYIVVNPSRSQAVIYLHFNLLLGRPVGADGAPMCNVFALIQRCWIHILRDVEKAAVYGDDNDNTNYERLRAIYRTTKAMDTADPDTCLDLERRVCEIASSYPEGHKRGAAK